MILTSEEIRKLIELTQIETVVPESEAFRFRVVRRGNGYAEDPAAGRLQAKLSMMLEIATKRESDARLATTVAEVCGD